jgi:OPA family glycerol-3-phosphate transporter-like MFS transporter
MRAESHLASSLILHAVTRSADEQLAAASLRRWQRVTLATLVVGYGGYYLCRANFSVALPLIADELTASGYEPAQARLRLGEIASLGVLAYAAGKFINGALTELTGGRRSFLSGMGLSALCTVAFAASGSLPLFSLAWLANRFVQSGGWLGAVKITSRWFPASAYGTAMGVVSLSFLLGDAVARGAMGALLARGASWRELFLAAAGALLAILLASAVLLRETPLERGAREPAGSGGDLFASRAAGADSVRPPPVRELLRTLLSSRGFRLVCAISLGLTLLRETFNTWTPTYFVDALGLAPSDAASASALFPLFGCASVLLAGWLSDRLGSNGRAWILFGGVALAIATLLFLALLDPQSSRRSAVALVAATGFLLIGPYSYLAGALSLDFGGKQGSAAAAGIIDGVGYLGGALAGGGVARLALAFGWPGAFLALSGVALATALCAWLFLRERAGA